MKDNNDITQSAETKPCETVSKTQEVTARKKVILNFLKHYKKKSYNHSHITDDFYNKIKKNGLTISQLYEIMCCTPATKRPPKPHETANVKKKVKYPLLSTPVSIDNFKKNVKSLGYVWDSKGYLRKASDDIKFEYAKQLYLYWQQKSSISISLEEIPYNIIEMKKKKEATSSTNELELNSDTTTNSPDTNITDNSNSDVPQQKFKYFISIYFKDNLDLDAIASLLYKLFSDSILGIMVGFGMIQIHCKLRSSANNIRKKILKIFNEEVYDGYYLFK